MRVLHVDAGKTMRGGQVFLKGLHQELLRQNIGSLCLIHPANIPFFKDIPESFDTWKPRGEGDILAWLKLLKKIKHFNPTLIHAHDARSLGIAKLTHIWHRKTIVATRGLAVPPKHPWKYRGITVVAISSFVAKSLEKAGISKEAIQVIPVGISPEPPPSIPFPQANLFLPEAFRVLFVGALEAWKDPMVLLQAADLLRDQPFQFVFIGDGPLRQTMARWIRDKKLEGIVQLVGVLPGAKAYMSHFDCLILPSREEAFGLVILEALQMGVPVLVSDCPSFLEILTPQRHTLTFPRGNAQILASHLRYLMDNPEVGKSWVTLAKKEVLPRYYLPDIAKKYGKLYEKVLSR